MKLSDIFGAEDLDSFLRQFTIGTPEEKVAAGKIVDGVRAAWQGVTDGTVTKEQLLAVLGQAELGLRAIAEGKGNRILILLTERAFAYVSSLVPHL